MDKNELKSRLEAVEKQNLGLLDEIKNLKAQLADMQDEPEIPDMPVFHANETYWRMYPTLEHIKGSVLHSDYNGECYNLFHTKEYADEFDKKCKLIAMMLHCKWYLDRDFVPDWKNNEELKYSVFYNNQTNVFGVTVRTSSETGYVAFSTNESAQKCADWLNKHWRDCDD